MRKASSDLTISEHFGQCTTSPAYIATRADTRSPRNSSHDYCLVGRKTGLDPSKPRPSRTSRFGSPIAIFTPSMKRWKLPFWRCWHSGKRYSALTTCILGTRCSFSQFYTRIWTGATISRPSTSVLPNPVEITPVSHSLSFFCLLDAEYFSLNQIPNVLFLQIHVLHRRPPISLHSCYQLSPFPPVIATPTSPTFFRYLPIRDPNHYERSLCHVCDLFQIIMHDLTPITIISSPKAQT